MPLASAQAILPSLAAVARDPGRDRALVRSLARWSERYTPLVAIDGDDGLFLDVTGCSHLFGGEAALLAEIPAELGRFGLTARTALAATAGAARALARWGRRERASPKARRRQGSRSCRWKPSASRPRPPPISSASA